MKKVESMPVCQGFGDILVPGLLLSYAHSFALLIGNFTLASKSSCDPGIKYKLYWVITCVAYVLGLVATFISLFLMNSAQPALLYLVSSSSSSSNIFYPSSPPGAVHPAPYDPGGLGEGGPGRHVGGRLLQGDSCATLPCACAVCSVACVR